jgi:hypothetical protein
MRHSRARARSRTFAPTQRRVQVAYVLNGVLGQVLLDFPECPWPASSAVDVSAHIDVWTVLPVIPPLLASGFEFTLHVTDDNAGAKEQLCLKLDLAQPPETGSMKDQVSEQRRELLFQF